MEWIQLVNLYIQIPDPFKEEYANLNFKPTFNSHQMGKILYIFPHFTVVQLQAKKDIGQ